MDRIHIQQMEFYAYHGALPEETKIGQRFIVDVSLAVSLREAGETDDLTKTVNYAEVYELCERIVTGKPMKLIEAVAETIATEVLAAFKRVKGVRVALIKPNPPIHGHYNSVSVEIVRGDYA